MLRQGRFTEASMRKAIMTRPNCEVVFMPGCLHIRASAWKTYVMDEQLLLFPPWKTYKSFLEAIYLFLCRHVFSSGWVCAAGFLSFYSCVSLLCLLWGVHLYACQSPALKALATGVVNPSKTEDGQTLTPTSECQARISEFFKCTQSEVPKALLLLDTERSWPAGVGLYWWT